jgi:hypothetical protein
MDTNIERHVFCSHLTAALCLKSPFALWYWSGLTPLIPSDYTNGTGAVSIYGTSLTMRTARVVGQAVSHRTLSLRARVQPYPNLCEICGAKCGVGSGSPPPPPLYHYPDCSLLRNFRKVAKIACYLVHVCLHASMRPILDGILSNLIFKTLINNCP